MYKFLSLLFLFSSVVFAGETSYFETQYFTKIDVDRINQQAKKLGIDPSVKISKIESMRAGHLMDDNYRRYSTISYPFHSTGNN